MKPYSELNAMPASAFLNPDNFITDWDRLYPRSEYKAEQYAKGLAHGKDAEYIIISANSTWGAKLKNGGYLTAYEGIGYHSHTASLLRGFLDSGAKILVYRDGSEAVFIK